MPKSSRLGRHDLRSRRHSLDAIEPVALTEHGDVAVDGNRELEVSDGAIEIFRRIGAFSLCAGLGVLPCHCALRILIGALRRLNGFLFYFDYHYFCLTVG